MRISSIVGALLIIGQVDVSLTFFLVNRFLVKYFVSACTMSEHNQLSKPSMIKINNNPNYRVDYYENNCFKSKFLFNTFPF
jgi:hypothetical protein